MTAAPHLEAEQCGAESIIGEETAAFHNYCDPNGVNQKREEGICSWYKAAWR